MGHFSKKLHSSVPLCMLGFLFLPGFGFSSPNSIEKHSKNSTLIKIFSKEPCNTKRFFEDNLVHFSLLAKEKKILVNQGCILKPIFVWHICRQWNKLSGGVPDIPVYTIFHDVFAHQIWVYCFLLYFLTLASILVWKRSHWPMLFLYFSKSP